MALGVRLSQRWYRASIGLLLASFAVTILVSHPTPVQAAPTPCSLYYDWAQQWTTNSANFYHPGSGCPEQDKYLGWVGIDGAVTTPSHFPNLPTGTVHSLGWINMSLNASDSAWIQEGWFAGCLPDFCATTSPIRLYEEARNGTDSTYVDQDIGGLAYSTSYILQIEYYPNTGGGDCGTYSGSCWKAFYNYNIQEAQYNAFPSSGAAAAGSEVSSYPYSVNGDAVAEMPITIYGSSDPTTNSGLRIKGANGYVPWNTSLSSGTTSSYDERTCANLTYCPHSPTYTVSNFFNYYKFEGFGACGSGGC